MIFEYSFIQFLVLNYIKEEYNTRNVYIYPKLIKDLDILAFVPSGWNLTKS